MPTRAPTPCPVCATLGPCVHRGQARRARRGRAHSERVQRTITDHVTAHGWICPGFGDHEPHESHDLTIHHLDGLEATGYDTGRHVVLCRSENSALGG